MEEDRTLLLVREARDTRTSLEPRDSEADGVPASGEDIPADDDKTRVARRAPVDPAPGATAPGHSDPPGETGNDPEDSGGPPFDEDKTRVVMLRRPAPLDKGGGGDDATLVLAPHGAGADVRPVGPALAAPSSAAAASLGTAGLGTRPAGLGQEFATRADNDDATLLSTAGAYPMGVGERPVQVGDTLNGRFLLDEVIAAGGMGVVYKAKDLVKLKGGVRDPHVALKMLGENFKPHAEAWKALLSEAEKTKALSHPNIIKVYDFDHDRVRDEYFMTMEYLEGQSLERLVRDGKGGPVEPPALAYHIIEGIARALEYAHTQTPVIVHSDIKPSNVVLTRDNVVKVLDFGIARVVRKGEAQSDKTVFGVETLNAYTVAYASCEIMEGWPPHPCDDVYALACIAYKLLSGRHPFGVDGERYGVRFARDSGLVPEPIKGLDKRQWRALTRGLAFARKDRTPTVAKFLEEVLPRKVPLGRKLAWGGGAVALLGGIGLAVHDFQQRTEVATREPACLAFLEPFKTEPATPAEWIEPAEQAQRQLADPACARLKGVQQEVDNLVAKLLLRHSRELAQGRVREAEGYLGLAEKLNRNPDFDARLRAARTTLGQARNEPSSASGVPSAGGTTQRPSPEPPAEPKSAEQQLIELIPSLDKLRVLLPKAVYRKREQIPLSIDVPAAGNLHVFYFQPGEKVSLIFPNAAVRDNRVAPGLKPIPKLVATPPYGKLWFIAVAESQAANLYRQYSEDKSRVQGGFVVLSAEELLSFLQAHVNDEEAIIGHAEMAVVK